MYTTTPETGRIQLALNVSDLASSIKFYSELFGTEPTKLRDGYANFAIAEPPLKLILFASGEAGGTINHLGVEVPTSADVDHAIDRMKVADLSIDIEQEVTCCYATQDKVWAVAPDGERWEYYTVLDDDPAETSSSVATEAGCACSDPDCGCTPESLGAEPAACCTALV